MKIDRPSAWRSRPLLPVVLCLLLAAGGTLPRRAAAVYVLTVSQVGNDVQVTGSGSLNTAALNPGDNASFPPQIDLDFAELLSGVPGSGGLRYGGISGPAVFGSGGEVDANSGTGSYVGIIGGLNVLVVPSGYVSGTSLTTGSVYNTTTLATLGFNPGTYVYTWGAGATADSLTVTSAVPEPSTWALVGVAGLGTAGVLRRRARTA